MYHVGDSVLSRIKGVAEQKPAILCTLSVRTAVVSLRLRLPLTLIEKVSFFYYICIFIIIYESYCIFGTIMSFIVLF